MNLIELNIFFCKLKNASLKKKLFFFFRASKDLEKILKNLQKIHFITGFGYLKDKTNFQIFLRYDTTGSSVIKQIENVSSSGHRIIINKQKVKTFLNNYPYSTAIIKTSQGMLNIQECFNRRIGGELLVYIH